jgi:hypothetical protein
MADISIKRDLYTDISTSGQLYVDGKFECYTLEDKVRPVKIAGLTAIPAGTYDVVITYSPRFDCDMPLLVNVPGFEGVRIHVGNTAADTDGCILVGAGRTRDKLQGSRIAYDALFLKIKGNGPCRLMIA